MQIVEANIEILCDPSDFANGHAGSALAGQIHSTIETTGQGGMPDCEEPSGLSWKWIGPTKPTGIELIHSDLADALSAKWVLTQREWDDLGIEDLRAHHYIKVGNSWMRPACVHGIGRRPHPATIERLGHLCSSPHPEGKKSSSEQ